ncbi:MAG: nucleotidyltransferase domain-containing protein [Candidatus Omnitrophica bacterium]|nr:nucleotidyltransferase domain-containing protein [Candidatus Omnitrophota bacterium]
MTLTSSQKQKIQEIGKKYDLKLIILHSSYASGKIRKGSDLDIAVLGKKPIESDVLLKIHSDLADVFGDDSEREVDLKSLHHIDPLFRYQVAKHSQLLFGRLLDYNEFRAYAFCSFYDAKDVFNLERLLILRLQDSLSKKYVGY